ncbi:unnamed protein product [Zymoseptoria tritici ST99CH_1A5]|uniref:Protein ZIP4 homolog n=1 Tax=Zymoseptoria tritici ST99CH_1A5 TaxID=1276529 RepID=A0A1Y6L495_ZYMTR|nr:unnamed protein product [Zymoseptoria tritici ST99CH_1A5]
MATSKLMKKDLADPRVQAVLDCANTARTILQDRSTLPTALFAQIESYVKQSLPHLKSAAIADKCRDFDLVGIDLWNYSAHLLHEDGPRDPRIKVVNEVHSGVVTRVFALLLLAAAHAVSSRHNTDDPGQKIRIMKVALRASRLCLDREELELASISLQRCSDFIPVESAEDVPLIRIANNHTKDQECSHDDFGALVNEYYLLRLLHSWKSDRLDLADHFYSKISQRADCAEADMTVKQADLMYEVARSLAKTGQSDIAVKWFERAIATLDRCDAQSVTQDVEELRLCTGVAFVELLVSDERDVSHQRAWEILEQLEATHGLYNRVAVQATRFRILAAQRQIDEELILQSLLRIVKMTVLTESSFKTAMKVLRQASKVASSSSLTALAELIHTRLLPELRDTHEKDSTIQCWLEKATVAYILCAKSPASTPQEISVVGIRELLDRIKSEIPALCFTGKATHAAQTLIWQAATGPNTGEWLHLLRHPVFDNAGHLNKARVGRKLMRHAMDHEDFSAAREAFFQMPKSTQDESITRYLAFKLALQSQDDELAMDSLKVVARKADNDPTYLYACVIEAQKSSMRHMGVAALQAIVGKRPQGVNLTALLRCTARLLMTELDEPGQNLDEVALQVIEIFENAFRSVDELRKLSKDSWRTEVQWWSKNAYNLGVRLCTDIRPESTVRLLETCTSFMDNYPMEEAADLEIDIETRRMLCAYLATTALVALGRSGSEDDEYTLQGYLHAQKHIKTFKQLHAKLRRTMHGDTAVQHEQRHFSVLKFELECILRLRQWHNLEVALQACLNSNIDEHWDTLADIVIIIHDQLDTHSLGSETDTLIRDVLQRAVDHCWKAQYDIVKIARWLRFAFTLCLDHIQDDFSYKLLLQAATIAEKARSPDQPSQDLYPDAELQWLATTGFNHAVDLIAVENHTEATKWMEGALELARWVMDEGALHALFTEKRRLADERAANTRG